MQKQYLLSSLIILGSLSLLTACSNNKIKEVPQKVSTTNKAKITVKEKAKKVEQLSVTKLSQMIPQKKLKKVKVKPLVKAKKVSKPAKKNVKRYTKNINYKKRPIQRASAQRATHHYKRKPARRISKSIPQRRVRPNASFAKALSSAALARTRHNVRYDGKYVKIGYPWGDVPQNIGVCTDVVIRAYRRLGVDLQKKVHEDMSQGGFFDYPNIKKWNLSSPDKNIDHRRVYNLQAFFRRHGAALPKTRNPYDYKPGDLVTWMVGPSFPHIGIVVDQKSKVDPRRHMIVHNIAEGPKMEDILFSFPITGHYRYNKSNRLIAAKRFKTNVAETKNEKIDYDRVMRSLSIPAKRSNPKTINLAQLKSQSGLSDADLQLLLKK